MNKKTYHKQQQKFLELIISILVRWIEKDKGINDQERKALKITCDVINRKNKKLSKIIESLDD